MGELVSWRNTIVRATASGLASGSAAADESAGASQDRADFEEGEDPKDREEPADRECPWRLAVNGLQLRRLLGFGRFDYSDTKLFLDEPLEVRGQLRVVAQEAAGVLHTLSQLVAVIGEP